jgi:hypothetical protein
MIYFKDFFPERLETAGFFADDKYENFSNLVTKVNQWISDTKIKIINIETIILRERDCEKTFFLSEEPCFYQFVRVWYEHQNEI